MGADAWNEVRHYCRYAMEETSLKITTRKPGLSFLLKSTSEKYSLACNMFLNIFNRSKKNRWDITIKAGDMIRTCRNTGRIEYRDCRSKSWIPLKTKENLDDVREKEWITPAPITLGWKKR